MWFWAYVLIGLGFVAICVARKTEPDTALFAGAFWPLAVAIFLGMLLADLFEPSPHRRRRR